MFEDHDPPLTLGFFFFNPGMVSFPVVLTANAQGDCSSIPGRRKRNQGRLRVFSRSAVGNIGTIHRQGHRKNKKKKWRGTEWAGKRVTPRRPHQTTVVAARHLPMAWKTVTPSHPTYQSNSHGDGGGGAVGGWVWPFFATSVTSRCKNIFNFFDLVFRFCSAARKKYPIDGLWIASARASILCRSSHETVRLCFVSSGFRSQGVLCGALSVVLSFFFCW